MVDNNGTERALGRLEEGLQRVSEQVKDIRQDMIEMVKGQVTVAQEVRDIKERQSDAKIAAKDNKATFFAIGALIVSAMGLLAQVFLK